MFLPPASLWSIFPIPAALLHVTYGAQISYICGKTQPQVPSVHLGQEFLRQRPTREEAAESDDLFRQSCHANKCWWIG
jgi:hypothetical protein